ALASAVHSNVEEQGRNSHETRRFCYRPDREREHSGAVDEPCPRQLLLEARQQRGEFSAGNAHLRKRTCGYPSLAQFGDGARERRGEAGGMGEGCKVLEFAGGREKKYSARRNRLRGKIAGGGKTRRDHRLRRKQSDQAIES